MRVLDELELGGPLRAVDIAANLGIPANQASFHLRQLAKYGLIVEAPEAARDGRDRVWRAVNEDGMRLDLSELEQAPGGKAAVNLFRRQWLANAHAAIDRAMQWHDRKDATVNVASGTLRLTKAEAKRLGDEIGELIERTRKAGTQGPKSAKTYEFFTVLQPAKDL
jgi:predicted ArsR family transcriptional regulator